MFPRENKYEASTSHWLHNKIEVKIGKASQISKGWVANYFLFRYPTLTRLSPKVYLAGFSLRV